MNVNLFELEVENHDLFKDLNLIRPPRVSVTQWTTTKAGDAIKSSSSVADIIARSTIKKAGKAIKSIPNTEIIVTNVGISMASKMPGLDNEPIPRSIKLEVKQQVSNKANTDVKFSSENCTGFSDELVSYFKTEMLKHITY